MFSSCTVIFFWPRSSARSNGYGPMEMVFTTDGKLVIEEIPPPMVVLLQKLPELAEGESRSPEAEERLFPSPGGAGCDEEFRADWRAFVEPDLHRLFQSARSTVQADLRQLEGDESEGRLVITRAHAEAWLNVLGQARLSIAAEHRLTDREINRDKLPPIFDERTQALARIGLFAYLQQELVELLTMEE